jgi:WD40 repeat protein
MTPEDYERMWLLFEEVKQKPSTERGAFLEERSSGNSELCREVVRLLAQDEAIMADFLTKPILRDVAFPPPAPADDPRIGQRVGPYEIQQRIGSGGMGVVYLGRRVEDYEQRVAIKLIQHGLQSGEVLRRFQDERQVLAALSHPHIARLLDGGSLDGQPYLVMEYIEGQPIDEYCQTYRLTLPQKLELFRTVCAAVEYAHQNLVLHRDLKPGNILVAVDGTPKLLDFGIAKLLNPQAWGRGDDATRTGRQPLTPEYASPEQIHGGKILTTTSDVYVLGVVLYELLTEHRPHEAAGEAEYELARRVCEDEPPPLRQWRPELPRDLEAICLKCLHKDPHQRYPSAAALADDLRRFQEGRPIVARPVGRGERLRKWVKRRPAVVALLAVSAVALLALGGIGVSLWHTGELETALRVAREATQEASAAHHLAKARAHRFSGQVGQRWKTLDELALAAGLGPRNRLELRNEAIACLTLPDLRLAKSWDGWLPGTHGLVFDAGLERYARSDEQGNISIRRVSDGVEISHLPGPGTHAYRLRFSADGKFLATLYDRHVPQLYVWDWRQGRTVLRHDTYGLPDFSPDSRQLVLGERKGAIRFFDLSLGQEVNHIPSQPGYHACAFDPGGRRLAVVCHADSDRLEISKKKVAIYDVPTGRLLTTISHTEGLDLPCWSPDGNFVVATCWDRCLYVWDAGTAKLQAILHGSDRQAQQIGFSRRGDLLATTGWDGVLRLWDPMTGRELLRKEGNVQAVQFSPDDRLLAWTREGSMIELWELTSGGAVCRTLSGPAGDGEVRRVDISPDGRFLASTSYRGVYLWRLSDSRRIAFLELGNTRGVAFHPEDGSLITCGRGGGAALADSLRGRCARQFSHRPSSARAGEGNVLASGPERRRTQVGGCRAGQRSSPLA